MGNKCADWCYGPSVRRHIRNEHYGAQYILKIPRRYVEPCLLCPNFTYIYIYNHHLSGRNHNALYDTQQTALMMRLFADLL
jgi:late competence protein required for DNA uptake (superfamily II DNA/RNA helicase)